MTAVLKEGKLGKIEGRVFKDGSRWLGNAVTSAGTVV
jgi:hypothetical protein